MRHFNLDFIKEFNNKFKTVDPEYPTIDIDPKYAQVRIRLMQEELNEAIEGIENRDIENIAKELADLVYVVLGTVSAFGLSKKFDEIFDEVHKSNMSKTYVEGAHKPQKLEGYKVADIGKVLKD